MIPKFEAVDFVSFYIEIPILIVMYIAWMIIKRPGSTPSTLPPPSTSPTSTPITDIQQDSPIRRRWWYSDLVDIKAVDLVRDEYEEDEEDKEDDEERDTRLGGKWRLLWRIYYWLV